MLLLAARRSLSDTRATHGRHETLSPQTSTQMTLLSQGYSTLHSSRVSPTPFPHNSSRRSAHTRRRRRLCEHRYRDSQNGRWTSVILDINSHRYREKEREALCTKFTDDDDDHNEQRRRQQRKTEKTLEPAETGGGAAAAACPKARIDRTRK